jgi:beta-N-acetylhexosaminidase
MAVATAFAVSAVPALSSSTPAQTPGDPGTWSNQRLAAQLVLAGVEMSHVSNAVTWARAGIGGVVLFGKPPADLGSSLTQVRGAEVVPPFVASDEEGGTVQRLTSLIYALPSAQWMGAHRKPARVLQMARSYGARMRSLGVDMELAPDADLLVPGNFIADEQRAFASSPTTDGHFVNAWLAGMRAAHVVPVVKHWPGHGHAADSHRSLPTTPPLSYLQTHDMVPFTMAFAQHVPVVMVGHLVVPGLTESSRTPASLSRRALHYLRSKAGADTLLVTDSLEMGAIQKSLGLSQPAAAVRALERGADMAMVQDIDPLKVVSAVAHALSTGGYHRASAVASARRVLAAKRISTPPHVPTMRAPADGATGVAVQGPLSALLPDRLGGVDNAFFAVRAHGATAWDVVPGAKVTAPAGSRASYAVPDGRLQPGQRYDWRVRACNSAGYCSVWSTVRSFTTASS